MRYWTMYGVPTATALWQSLRLQHQISWSTQSLDLHALVAFIFKECTGWLESSASVILT